MPLEKLVKDAQIKQTPTSDMVLWESPHLDKGMWKMSETLRRPGVSL